MRVDTKPKICHICSYYENILFDNLVVAQREITEPRVFFFKKYGREEQYHKDYIDEVNCFHETDRYFFFLKEKKAFSALVDTYKGQSFDINFAHSLFVNGYLAYKAKRLFGIPYVVMVQNTDLNVFYKYRPYLKSTGLKILLDAHKIIFASESYKDTLVSKYVPRKHKNAVAEKSVVIPYGIEDVFFDNRPCENKNTDKTINVISVGLICRNKNQINLCKAIDLLRKEGRDISLTIIGKTGNEAIAKQINGYDFVNTLPYMTKESLKDHYREHHLFALASFTETFGLVYAEALSQGLPILYSKGQGFDRQFPEGWVGYSVDAWSISSISEGIMSIVENYPALSARTMDASAKFKWETVTEQYMKIYKEIMGDNNEHCYHSPEL